jgi:glycosyltransferase involved in cell wall biosynthesis
VRVLVLDQFSEIGGGQTCLLMALEAMRASGWNVAVGLPGEGDFFRRINALGFETFSLSCGPYGLGRKSAIDLARFLTQLPRLAGQIRFQARRFSPDLVYVNGPRLLPAAALAHLRLPVFFHTHSKLANRALLRFAGEALHRLHAWVAGCCQFVAEPWQEFAAPDRLAVIFNGVSGPSAPLFRPRRRTPRIGCIGRISLEKGQIEFLAAAAIIHRALPESRFAIYGAPLFSSDAQKYYEKVLRAARGLPVEFAGWAGDVYQALSDIDVLLVPSAPGEGSPLVILEAFAAGIPVIAFPSGGIPEVIEHGRTAFLVPSVEEMAACALELLCGNHARLQSVSEAARRAWETRFTPEQFRHRVLEAAETAARSCA